MDKSKQFIYLFILFLALGTAGWYYVHPKKTHHSVVNNDSLPDAIVTGVRLLKFNEAGLLSNRVYAPKMVHFIKDNISLFTHPAIVIYGQPNTAPWLIKSNRGSAIHGDEEIDLSGHVRIHQPRQGDKPESIITTEFLRYFPQKKMAQTSQHIELKRPGLTISSEGMQAFLDTERVTLLSQARGLYEPSTTATH